MEHALAAAVAQTHDSSSRVARGYGDGTLMGSPARSTARANRPHGPPLCIGTAELSGHATIFPHPPGEEEALAIARAILDGPIAFLDTAAGYGESERRIASTVVGISRPERRAQTVALARHPIPEEFWSAVGAISPATEDLG